MLQTYSIIALAWLISLAGVGYSAMQKGIEVGKNEVAVAQFEQDARDLQVQKEIQETISSGLASIKIENTTINKKIERIVETNTVYKDCVVNKELEVEMNKLRGYK